MDRFKISTKLFAKQSYFVKLCSIKTDSEKLNRLFSPYDHKFQLQLDSTINQVQLCFELFLSVESTALIHILTDF